MEQLPEDQGRLRLLTVANPGGGADWTLAVPARVRWRIVAVSYKFTASSDAGDRNVSFMVRESTSDIFVFPVDYDVIANATKWITWGCGYVAKGSAAGYYRGAGLGSKLLVHEGMHIGSRVSNMKTMDQITDVKILVEEWIEPLA